MRSKSRTWWVVVFLSIFIVSTVSPLQAQNENLLEWGDNVIVDLTDRIPTFRPVDGNQLKADLTKPVKGSKPIFAFGQPAILIPRRPGKTPNGSFTSFRLVTPEHYGTHMDAPVHWVTSPDSPLSKNRDTRSGDEMTLKDLIGRVVVNRRKCKGEG